MSRDLAKAYSQFNAPKPPEGNAKAAMALLLHKDLEGVVHAGDSSERVLLPEGFIEEIDVALDSLEMVEAKPNPFEEVVMERLNRRLES